MNETAIVIMAKAPSVGDTKTRLTPPLSPRAATALYEAMLRDMIALAGSITGTDLAIAVTPPESIAWFREISPPGTLLLPVACTDIGDCLTQVLGDLLGRGYPGVFALNADSPSLPQAYIQDAIRELKQSDVVFGPAQDGGYYLVGLKRLVPELFMNLAWSTDAVLAESLRKAQALGLVVHLLPDWYDLDTAEDLRKLKAELAALPEGALIHTRKALGGTDIIN